MLFLVFLVCTSGGSDFRHAVKWNCSQMPTLVNYFTALLVCLVCFPQTQNPKFSSWWNPTMPSSIQVELQHGMHNLPLYLIWNLALQRRCVHYNRNTNKKFPNLSCLCTDFVLSDASFQFCWVRLVTIFVYSRTANYTTHHNKKWKVFERQAELLSWLDSIPSLSSIEYKLKRKYHV